VAFAKVENHILFKTSSKNSFQEIQPKVIA